MVQVGTTKDQGLYNKPSAAVHPRALAAGTLPQYNTIQYNCCSFRRILMTFGELSKCRGESLNSVKIGTLKATINVSA